MSPLCHYGFLELHELEIQGWIMVQSLCRWKGFLLAKQDFFPSLSHCQPQMPPRCCSRGQVTCMDIMREGRLRSDVGWELANITPTSVGFSTGSNSYIAQDRTIVYREQLQVPGFQLPSASLLYTHTLLESTEFLTEGHLARSWGKNGSPN